MLLVLRRRVLELGELEVCDRDDALVGGHLREELAHVVVASGDLDLDGLARVEVLLHLVLRREASNGEVTARALLYVLQHHRQFALLGQERLEVFVVGLRARVVGLELVEALRGDDRARVSTLELRDLSLDRGGFGARARGYEVPEDSVDEERDAAEQGGM